MRMCRMILYFLVLLIRESNVQGQGFCPKNKPAVKFCTISELTNLTDVYIDTISVPKHQESFCECTIFRSSSAQFKFSFYYEAPENMVLKINNNVLGVKGFEFAWSGDTAKLSLLTTKNYTDEGACLIVSPDDKSSFNITCKRSVTSTTETSTSSTSIASESSTRQETDTQPYTREKKDTGKINVIIPAVAALAGLLFLVVVILVVIYRRRSVKKEEQPTTSTEDVGKEVDDDYYMTENPMYNATEPQPNVQYSENEYHYIEPDNHVGRRSINHYESLPDSPLTKQIPPKETDQEQHYAYSTCIPKSQRSRPVVSNEGTVANKSDIGSLPNKQSGVDENTYDSTDKTVAKHFIGVNEYHHLTPSGSRKKVAIDTYNTVGNVGDNKQEADEEESEYHVASLR